MAPSTALSRRSHGRGSHRARRTGSKAETPTLYPVRTSHTGGAKCPGEGHSGDGTLTPSEADRLPIARAHRGGGPRAGQEVEACGVRPQEENRRAGVQGCRGTDTKTHSVHNLSTTRRPEPALCCCRLLRGGFTRPGNEPAEHHAVRQEQPVPLKMAPKYKRNP